MYKGFYNLASGVLTHQRNLDVIANNMVNVSTPGFKQDRYTATTFDEVLYSRVGNKDSIGTEIGGQSYIRATSDVETDFTQGTLEPTGLPLDFAIAGEGFFAVESVEDGSVFYTRNGSFSLDEEGFLCLPGYGRVLSATGNPLQIRTDQILVDHDGVISYAEGGTLGQLGVYTFANNDDLVRDQPGFFTAEGAQLSENPDILQQHLERSNTDIVKQMTDMISYQRSLQSATQVMKMYDSLMNQATTDIGRM